MLTVEDGGKRLRLTEEHSRGSEAQLGDAPIRFPLNPPLCLSASHCQFAPRQIPQPLFKDLPADYRLDGLSL